MRLVGNCPKGSQRFVKDFDLYRTCCERSLEGFQLRADILGLAFQDLSVGPVESTLEADDSE